MYSNVVVQFRMKGRDRLITLPGGNDVSVDDGQCLGIPIYSFDVWCTYERHGDLTHSIELSLCGKTSELSAVSVAA